MTRDFKCRACAKLAVPGERFCCDPCRIAFEHEREMVRDREPVIQGYNLGRSQPAWIFGLHLPLQNSA